MDSRTLLVRSAQSVAPINIRDPESAKAGCTRVSFLSGAPIDRCRHARESAARVSQATGPNRRPISADRALSRAGRRADAPRPLMRRT